MWRSYPPKNGGFGVENAAKQANEKVIHKQRSAVIHIFEKVGVDNPYLSTFWWKSPKIYVYNAVYICMFRQNIHKFDKYLWG